MANKTKNTIASISDPSSMALALSPMDAQTLQDLKHSVLIVSVSANIIALAAWMVYRMIG